MRNLGTLSTATLLLPLALVISASASGHPVVVENDHWTIWYNCERKGYDAFHYTTVPDTGSEDRHGSFHDEDQLPAECQQLSTDPYSVPEGVETTFDRGHGVHANLWDHDEDLIRESNSMANIVPQASRLNRWGAWRHTEKLTECWREHGEVEVWGGVIWGDDTGNDYFIASHGVATPDTLWKVIQFPDGEVNAWLFPNDNSPDDDHIDDYLVHPSIISSLHNIELSFNFDSENINTTKSRAIPDGCDLE